MTTTDTPTPGPEGTEPVTNRSSAGDPPGEAGSNAGLYLVLALFGGGIILIVLKLIGLWE